MLSNQRTIYNNIETVNFLFIPQISFVLGGKMEIFEGKNHVHIYLYSV